MSGIDHFLQSIGAITLPKGTSADPNIPEVIKALSAQIDEMRGHSSDFSNGIEIQLAKDAVHKAEEFAAAHEYEKAYGLTIRAALLVGHAARNLESIKDIGARIDAAFKEPAAAV